MPEKELPEASAKPEKQRHPDRHATSANLSRRGFLGGLGAAAGTLLASPATARDLPGAGRRHPGAVGSGSERLDAAYQSRIDAADRMYARGTAEQTPNGDELDIPGFVANFSKGLPHNAIGEVDPGAFEALRDALTSGVPDDFEFIPIEGARRLCNPQAGLAFDTEGFDPHQFAIPPAPKFSSAEEAGEMVELYWMALLRDARFGGYHLSSLVQTACDELNALSDFRGPRQFGKVTPMTLFRDDLPGATKGPYISQFMLLPTPFGAEYVERRMRCLRAGDDHMTEFGDWLAVQNGNVPGTQSFLKVRRHVRNGRDLAQWVHIDVLFQAYFNACLILGTPPNTSDPHSGGIGCPTNPANPYRSSTTQDGFGTWGPPGFKTLLCEVSSRALKAVWYQKWFVHRRLRPETFGGRVHVHKSALASYPIHDDVLSSEAVDRVHQKFGTYLLPMVFPEGSPIHPAYGAGHATVAGACTTILKALFDENFEFPNPVVTNATGTALLPFQNTTLTVGGELNKLASNVATGRNIAGVHWRTDAAESLRLGEAIAIAVLQDHLVNFNEGGGCEFTNFDGEPVVLSA
jgi:hypothetical protein